MDPKLFGRMLLRRRRTVITAVLVVTATVFFGSLRKAPQYVATCQVQFTLTAYDPTDPDSRGYNPIGGPNDFIEYLKSPEIAQRVATQVKLPVAEIAGKVSPSVTPNTTNTFDITIADSEVTPAETTSWSRYGSRREVRAQDICNGYGQQFIAFQLEGAKQFYKTLLKQKTAQLASVRAQVEDYQAELIKRGGEGDRRNLQLVIERDTLLKTSSNLTEKIVGLQDTLTNLTDGGGRFIKPAGPGVRTGADHKKDLLFGLMVGLMFGVMIALARDYLDDTVRDKESTQRELGLPVLAALPLEEEIDGFGEPSGSTIEAARTLRATLASMGFPHEKSTLVVTSTLAKRRSTTLAALAAAVAESGRSVLVLGTDMRGGRTHEAFGIANTVGLANVIRGQIPMERAIRPAPGLDGVYVLPCGPIIGNPGELLSSEEMAMTLRRARRWADVVLLDAPPVLAAADSSILGSYADGVILVVSAGQTNRAQANEAKEQLAAAGARVLGAVLVGSDETTQRADNNYDDFGSMPTYGGWGGSGGYDAGGYVDYYAEEDALTMSAHLGPRSGSRSRAPKKVSASRPGQRPRSSAKAQTVPRNARTTGAKRKPASSASTAGRGSTTARKPASSRTNTATARKNTSAARKPASPARRTTASRSTGARTVRATVKPRR